MNKELIKIYRDYDMGLINIYEMINKMFALGLTEGEIMYLIGDLS